MVRPVSGFEPARARWALLGAFVTFGIFVGAQGVLWAEVVPALGLREGTFGASQLVPPLVAIGVMLAGGALSVRVGNKGVIVAGLALLAGSAAGLGRAGGLPAFLGALALQGAAFGGLEVSVNGAALDWERAVRRPVMNLMHAGFSGGAVGGALGVGALLELGVPYRPLFGVLVVVPGLALAATLPVRFPPVAMREAAGDGSGWSLARLLAAPALLRLAAIAVLGIVGESVANTWSVLHLRALGASALVGGSAFALFNGAMAVGRIGNGVLVARGGARVSLLASGTGLVLAAGLLVLSTTVTPAVLGFVVLGLAVAGVIPTTLAATAPVATGPSGAGPGAIMAAGYLGFMLAPPLVGHVAELASLRVALGSLGLCGAGILVLGRALPCQGGRRPLSWASSGRWRYPGTRI